MRMLVALVIVLALYPSQTLAMPISVHVEVQPQPLSFLGFYDTVFTLDFVVNITNNQEGPLPSGNLTLHIEAPSGKYSTWYIIPFTQIAPHASAAIRETLRPAESGIYTFHMDWYSVPNGKIDLTGTPLTVVDLLGPERVYGSVAGLAVAIIAVCVALRKRK